MVANWVMVSTTGYSLLGGDLFTLFFIVFLVLLGLTLIRPLIRKLVWRVRNRLFVTYFLIGALPLALVLIIVFVGFYLLVGQAANYLLKAELDRGLDELGARAQQMAQDALDGRRTAAAQNLREQAVLRIGNRTSVIPETAPIKELPSWNLAGFKGIVRTDAGS